MALSLALAGCTMMVNGKPRRIGGGGDDTTAAAQPPPPAAAAPADKGKPPAPPPGTVVVLRADDTLGRDPIIAQASATFDTTFARSLGWNTRHDCRASDLPSRPVASVEITKANLDVAISVDGPGAMAEGFVLRKGDRFWEACDLTMQAPKGGFEPGKYDIYPFIYVHKDGAVPFQIELSAPHAPHPWGEKLQKLEIANKLAKPMFVEVTTAKNRRKLRAAYNGDRCEDTALGPDPDLAITVDREIPGLTVRPLPTATQVTLRREKAESKNEHDRYCQEGRGADYHGPTYRAKSEIGLGNQEGTFGISVGTPDGTTETKVTLMIFDDSTKFDAAAPVPFGDDKLPLELRVLALQFPQLDVRELNLGDYAHAELATRVYAAAPRHAFVYAKLDFDKDLVGGGDKQTEFPKKDEPMLVVEAQGDRLELLAADGATYHVKSSHVVLAPSGAPAVLAAPRALDPKIDHAIALLPPSAKKLADAHFARLKRWDDCRERAWAPYGRQLPTITHPAGVDLVVVKSPRAQQIEDAGDRAMDNQCGTEQARDKQTEVERKKMLVEIGKARAALLATATAPFKK